MADAMQGLRQLADVLNVETARLSGDPQRLQLALGESESRKLQEVNNLIDAEIDKLDMPESQKRLLKALSPQEKYQAIYGSMEPEDASKQIKREELDVLRELEKLGGDVSQLSPYQKNIYDNYIAGQQGNPLLEAIAGKIGAEISPPPKYRITNPNYQDRSVDELIKQSERANRSLTRKQVIDNLIANGILAEG